MAEYIEREAALMKLMQDGCSAKNLQSISDMPAADVAPVVRCKDCKHRYSDSWCEYVDDDDNFYCARGERKDGGDSDEAD